MSNNCILLPSSAAIVDPQWANVVLYMPFDGANNSTGLVDLKGHPLTRVGSPVITTSRSKFDASSLLINDLMDQVQVDATDGALAMGNNVFTIEGFSFIPSFVGTQGLFQISIGGYFQRSLSQSLAVAVESTRWQVYAANANNIVSGNVPPLNTFFHWALERYAGNTKLYLNGAEIFSVADSVNYTSTYFGLNGIWDNTGGLRVGGGHDDVRVTKGFARYKGPFTVPTNPFGRQ